MPPGRFLSDAEIERLEAWPEAIERRDVVRFFSPAGEDLAFVREQRGAPNQLGIALRPLPLQSRHPTRRPPTAQEPPRPDRHDDDAEDAEPRLTLNVKIRA